MSQPTVTCASCGAERVEKHMLRIECNLPEHQGGSRDCLAPFYVCRPALSGRTSRNHRPDCLSRTVMGADIHRIEATA